MVDRCAITDLIDSLGPVNDPSFLPKLKEILNMLAYEYVAGETSALAYHEEWRQQYTDRLYEETGADHAKGMQKTSRHESRHDSRQYEAKMRENDREAGIRDSSIRDAPPRRRPQQAPPSNRPRGDIASMPASLRAILEGTHKSLNEEG